MVVKLPVEILKIEKKGIHLLVKAGINGKNAAMIVDTGASNTVLDINSYDDFAPGGVTSRIEAHSATLGSSNLETHTAKISRLSFGQAVLTNYTVILLDLSNINHAFRDAGLPEVHGVLGGDLLMRMKATIDYKGMYLKLRVRNKMQPKQLTR